MNTSPLQPSSASPISHLFLSPAPMFFHAALCVIKHSDPLLHHEQECQCSLASAGRDGAALRPCALSSPHSRVPRWKAPHLAVGQEGSLRPCPRPWAGLFRFTFYILGGLAEGGGGLTQGMGGSRKCKQDQESNPADGWARAGAGIERRCGRDARSLISE